MEAFQREQAGTSSGKVHKAQLLAVLDALPIAVMLRAADGSLLHANPATVRFLARLGLDVSHVAPSPSAMMNHIDVIDEHGRLQDRAHLPVVSAMREGADREAMLGYALPDGGWAWYATRAVPLTLTDGTIGTVVTCDDVTDRRLLEEELRTAALVDPLTGLDNRRALSAALDDAQQFRARAGGDVGLLFLDLDGFKIVNDKFGHEAGDRVLVETGSRLRAATRAVDRVCRVGGDEFAVLCAPVDGAEGMQELVARIRSLPPVPVLVDGEALAVRGSIGAVLVEPEDRLDQALRRADVAMYDHKRSDHDSLLVIG
ncbi:MAG: diguanylate cyclase domain-containing protein [Acidimicrobiia bacterium]